MSTDKDLDTTAVAESLSSSLINRKRSRSSDTDQDDALIIRKKSLFNGELADIESKDEPAAMEEKEQSLPERVVILDAGAQYGKVKMLKKLNTQITRHICR